MLTSILWNSWHSIMKHLLLLSYETFEITKLLQWRINWNDKTAILNCKCRWDSKQMEYQTIWNAENNRNCDKIIEIEK